MEAFPTIFLVTQDSVLANAIPAQITHALQAPCAVHADWQSAMDALPEGQPTILVADAQAGPLPDFAAFRAQNPLTALLVLGGKDIAETTIESIQLSAFTPRPVSLPALIRSLEHLAYARQITAAQQSLKLTEGAHCLPHRKIIVNQMNGGEHTLTDKEVALLLCLYHHRQEKLPRQYLLEEVWGYSEGVSTHTLETHLYRLRQKLKEATGSDTLIRTEQGTYQLVLS